MYTETELKRALFTSFTLLHIEGEYMDTIEHRSRRSPLTPHVKSGDRPDKEYIVHPDLPISRLVDDRGNYLMKVIQVTASNRRGALKKALQEGYIPSNTLITYFWATPVRPYSRR